MNLAPLNSSALGRGVTMSSSQSELIPERFADSEISQRVRNSFGDDEHNYFSQALATMDLYVELFGEEPRKFQELVDQGKYHGPFDLMKKLPKGSQLFDFDSEYDKYLGLKRELFLDSKRRKIAFQPSGEFKEFWTKFLEVLSKKHSSQFLFTNNKFTNEITGEEWDLNKHDPMDVAALSVQEDLILIEKKRGDSPVIKDISVCFPSRWSPMTAPGKRVIDVHQIVPKFIAAGLGDSINEILNNLHDAGIRFTRLVHPFSQLNQSAELGLKEIPDGVSYDKNNIDDLFVRVEKQRFFSGDYITGDPKFKDLLMMSIKTYVVPLKTLKASPAFAKGLLRLHQRFVPEKSVNERRPNDVFRIYRGGTKDFLFPLLDYLHEISDKPVDRRALGAISVPRDIYSKPVTL